MSLTLASEISDSIAIVAAVFSSAASARPASSGSAGALQIERERQHLRSDLGAERRRLLQQLLIASGLLLEQSLERARSGRGTNLGHWFHLSKKAGWP